MTSGGADSNGDFTAVGGLPDGTYYAATSNWAGYAEQLYDGLPYFEGSDVTTGTPIVISGGVAPPAIEFLLNAGCTVAGTVTDQATGAGLPGIDVILHDASGTEVATWTSDATGSYGSGPSLPAGTYYARTSSPLGIRDRLYDSLPCDGGCDVTAGTPITLADGEERIDIDFALPEAGFIEGTITDGSTGVGLIGIYVRVLDSEGQQVAMGGSDANGAYSTGTGLDPGTYFVRTENYDGYYDELYDDIVCLGGCDPAAGTPVVVGPGETVSGIDFSLAKGGSISGTVTDQGTGLGVENVVVEFYDSSGAFVAEDFTDSNGDYVTRTAVPAGTYFSKTDSIWVGLEYEDQLYDGFGCSGGCDVTTGTPITVLPNEAVTGINYVLRGPVIFLDSFESGNVDKWSSSVD